MKANKKVRFAMKQSAVLACATAAVTAFPAFAFAEEGGGGVNAILPDMAEFIPMLLAFIILCIVLGKFGWPAFNNMMEKREEAIRDSLEKSEAARMESERVLAEYKKQLADAHTEALQIVANAKEAGSNVRNDITKQAQQEADRIVEQARVSIEAEKKIAISELRSAMVDTSVEVASRIVGEDLSDEEHRAIIERYVNEAGSFNGN